MFRKRQGGFPAKSRGGRSKKRVNEDRVPVPARNEDVDIDDEILSDEVDGIAGDRAGDLEIDDYEEEKIDMEESDEDDLEEQETADQKRIRLAKELIAKKKEYNTQVQQEEEDDFFLNNGVQRIDDEGEGDAITRALQLDHRKKVEGVFVPVADNIKKSLAAKKYKVEILPLKGHTKCATAIELDSTGKFLYSVSKDGSLIKWDINEGKKAVLNLGPYDKDTRPCVKELLCASLSFDDKYLITGGNDKMIRLWDTRDMKLIDTFRGHKDAVLGVKFKSYSWEFCSVGADRVLKLWDASERAFLETFYGHQSQVNAIDAIGENIITSGFDRQVVFWKTAEGSQLLFKGGNYSLDSIKAINPKSFVTGSQDGTVALWATNKSKPVFELPEAHGTCWTTALGSLYNTDLVVSGSYNDLLNFYKFDSEKRSLEKVFDLPSTGIVNDIKISAKADIVATCEGDEHRLGRWITSKAKNRIKIYRLK